MCESWSRRRGAGLGCSSAAPPLADPAATLGAAFWGGDRQGAWSRHRTSYPRRGGLLIVGRSPQSGPLAQRRGSRRGSNRRRGRLVCDCSRSFFVAFFRMGLFYFLPLFFCYPSFFIQFAISGSCPTRKSVRRTLYIAPDPRGATIKRLPRRALAFAEKVTTTGSSQTSAAAVTRASHSDGHQSTPA